MPLNNCEDILDYAGFLLRTLFWLFWAVSIGVTKWVHEEGVDGGGGSPLG